MLPNHYDPHSRNPFSRPAGAAAGILLLLLVLILGTFDFSGEGSLFGEDLLPRRDSAQVPNPAEEIPAPDGSKEVFSPVSSAWANPEEESRWQTSLVSLTVGYRAYRRRNYLEAKATLQRAVGRPFPLADYAEYFFALSTAETGGKKEGVALLEDFAERYPGSPFLNPSVVARSAWLVDLNRAEESALFLLRQSSLNEEPMLLRALARAYLATGEKSEASEVYQRLYYSFPLSDAGKEAEDALRRLRRNRRVTIPSPAVELQSRRADILFDAGHFRDAAQGYRTLLRRFPDHLQRERWKLRRVFSSEGRRSSRRKRLVRSLEAFEPEDLDVEGERLQALVAAYHRLGKRKEMYAAVEQMAEHHPDHPGYEMALMEMGNHYLLRGKRRLAAGYYGQLVERFPQGSQAEQAHWRTGWMAHLEGNRPKAVKVWVEHIRKYPSSGEVPTALYWLGRYAQDRRDLVAARVYFQRLVQSFPFSYYGLQARERLLEGWGRTGIRRTQNPFPLVLDGDEERGQKTQGRKPNPEAARVAARADLLRRLSLENLEELELTYGLNRFPDSREVNFGLAKRRTRSRRYLAAIQYAVRAYPGYRSSQIEDLPREVWDVLFPRPFFAEVRAAGERYGIDPYLILGLIRQESAFYPRAHSAANARGLMQLIPATGRRMARESRKRYRVGWLYRPDYNLDLGSRYLRFLLDRFTRRPEHVLAAYNSGEHRVDRWLRGKTFREPAEFVSSIPFSETRSYVRLVMSNREIYRRLHGEPNPAKREAAGASAPRPPQRKRPDWIPIPLGTADPTP